MFDETINKKWKTDFFKIFATNQNNLQELENADKLKIEHFPPVIAQYYPENTKKEELDKLCKGKLTLTKSKLLDNYNDKIIQTNYEKIIKSQLNNLMQQQIAKLEQEDPNFLKDEEKEIINKSNFPFIKLMTLVYTKDTDDMTPEDQKQWKEYMNQFITQQIVFSIVNAYFTMKLYQDNIYSTTFQTPYNNQQTWEKYTDNQTGFNVVYDFKEITENTVRQLKKLFPVLYVNQQPKREDFDYTIYNSHCASLLKINSNYTQYDNEWNYITNHKYTETEYRMLDNLLEPVYNTTMNSSKIQEILKNNYLETDNDELNYNYKHLIQDVSSILDSEELHNIIEDKLQEVYNITENNLELTFMKPEAIYLGINFPQDKLETYKQIAQENDVAIFQIKEKEGTYFKALI